MRMRIALSVVCAAVLVFGAAVAVTAARSEAAQSPAPAPATSAVSLARGDAADARAVTVPALPGAPSPTTAVPVSNVAASQSAAAAAEAAAARAAAARAAAAKAAAQRAAAARAAAAKLAALKVARAKAAAQKAAAAEAARKAAAARAAAAKVAARKAAATKAAAAKAAAARAAAEANAAAHPAPDTSEAVEEATEEAAEDGMNQSVIVMNKQTGSVTTSIDAEATVPAMSLFKIIVAADVINRAGGVGDVAPGTLARLRQMIIASDDSIAQDFYDDDGQGDIVTRVANEYGLSETTPSPEPRYWGDVRISAHDMASLLYQLLSNTATSAWFTQTMQASRDVGADGFDQNFGVNSVPGAGSKQGWGCCLGDVIAIHSMGFTANQIIVVLSTADPDVSYKKLGSATQLAHDRRAQASIASVTRTVDAALPPS